MISLRDRYRGTLVGVLAGDALGAPYEWKKASDIVIDLTKRGGLVPFDYIEPFHGKRLVAQGHPTDDSELTAALAQSIVARQGFDAADVFRRLQGFIHGNDGNPRASILTDDEAYGSGSTLRAALRPETYAESQAQFAVGTMPLVPSNGSLMRNAPVALFAHEKYQAIAMTAWQQSSITHQHPICVATCIAHACVHSYLLDGIEPVDAWHRTCKEITSIFFDINGAICVQDWCVHDEMFDALTEIIRIRIERPSEEELVPDRCGGALTSLKAALWALMAASDFRDGITKAVSLGGDTDTYAAIAGGLLGALYGIDGIPLEWQKVLLGRERMIELADKLLQLNQSEKK